MPRRESLNNQEKCEMCQHALPPKYNRKICPSCLEYTLFQQVKDFIRSGDFNEYQVAQRFNLPLSTVRKWIREGRIQYKEAVPGRMTMHCQVCGTQITFGSICPKCLKEKKVSGGLAIAKDIDSANMHHLLTNNQK